MENPGQSEGQRQYDAGYQAGRAACLRTASAAAALAVLEAKQDASPAYVAGFEWALWDYNDANGLRATSESSAWHRRPRLRLGSPTGSRAC
jgi:hypothetical protein